MCVLMRRESEWLKMNQLPGAYCQTQPHLNNLSYHITQQKFLKTGFQKAAYCGSTIVHWWYQMQIPDVKSDQIHIYAPWYVDVNLFSLF